MFPSAAPRGNIEILGKQNELFPSGPVIKCLINVIASTLREKLHVPAEQFKAYFLALLADKDFSRVIETISKVDKSFQRSTPFRTQTRRGSLPYRQPYFQAYQRPPTHVICYKCGEPGHKSPQCWKRAPPRQPSSAAQPGFNHPST